MPRLDKILPHPAHQKLQKVVVVEPSMGEKVVDGKRRGYCLGTLPVGAKGI